MRGNLSTLPPPPKWQTHALFLDFDGTLVAIAERPELVEFDTRARDLVTRLSDATDGATAIVSGRSLKGLTQHLGDLHVPLVGSHGHELQLSAAAPQKQDAVNELTSAARLLGPLVADSNLIMERKPGAVAIHYRSHPELGDQVRGWIDQVARKLGMRSMHGKMVSEVAPCGIDKGTAIFEVMKYAPFMGRLPIMIGDDTTDEDGFRAAQDLHGFGLCIGSSLSCADYRAPDRESALEWLERSLGVKTSQRGDDRDRSDKPATQ
ncbi:trehalose-phosphatase [Yangia sp. PrR004]|nr:trehalose-phosphatase [Salipiger sp. PrR004]